MNTATLLRRLAITAIIGAAASSFAAAPVISDFDHCVAATPGAAIQPASGVSYSDVPVLLRLSTSIPGFSYADFQRPDYADLAIFDESMLPVPYEVQVWEPTGESLVWAKVPTLTSETVLTVAYGDTDAAENDPTAVWSAYAIASHLDELGAAGTVADATGNNHDGACWSGSTGLAGGVIGGYRDNRPAGAEGQGGISFADTASTASLDLGQNFTLEAWVQLHTRSTGWDHLFYKKEESGSWEGFATELYSQSGAYGQLSILGRGDNNTSCRINHGIADADTWYHIQLVYSGTSVRLYNNGTLMGTGSLSADRHPTWNRNVNVSLGIDSDLNSGSWNGSFDEFRLIGVSFDDGRAAIEHAIQADPDAFSYSYYENSGNQPVPGTPSISYADGVFSVTASLTEGAAASVKAVFDDGTEVELAPNGATAPWTNTVPVSSALASGRTYTYLIRAQDANVSAVARGSETFHTGTVTVEATDDAHEEHLVPGAFTFRRADTAHDLLVAYSVGGTATAGTDYTAISGTVTIPAGSATAQVSVQPLSSPFTDEDVTVVATVAAGLYTPSATPATVNIVNARAAEVAKYSHRLPLAVNQARYGLDDALAGLPVLVRLSEDIPGFSYSDFQRDDYADLAFAAADNIGLPYEIDTWDPDGTSLVWVRVPDFTKDTVLTVLYGSASAAENTPSGVWSDYVGVWHFEEDGNGVLTVHDATANALDGTTTANSVAVADGAVGAARSPSNHQGGTSALSHILVPYSPAMAYDNPGFLTVSLWVRLPSTEQSWDYLIGRRADDNNGAWALQFNSGNGATALRFYKSGNAQNALSMGGELSRNEWHLITAVWDGDARHLYIDGNLTGEYSANWNYLGTDTTSPLAIGGAVNDDTWGAFSGDMDEVRIQPGVRSAAWAAADYAMATYADFWIPGAVQTVDNSAPGVGYARVADNDGTAVVEIPLEAGGGSVYAIVRDASGAVTTNALAGGAVLAAPATPSFAISTLPAANAWYDVASYAASGTASDSRGYGARVYTGAASVKKAVDAARDGLLAGAFIVSVECGESGLSEPLEVGYALSGTAAADTDYAALPGTVTIPAGSSCAYIDVTPLSEGAGGTVEITLVPVQSPVAAGARSASLAILADGVSPREKTILYGVHGYDGEAVSSFPALLRLREEEGGKFAYADVRDRIAASDIHFTLPDGTPVPHEIDTWDNEGESTVWVLLPSLANGATIVLHCGGAPQASSVSDVWSGMTGVWHLHMDAASQRFLNAAAADSGNTLRAWDSGTAAVDGIVGGARRISNGNQKDGGGNGIGISNSDALDIGDTFTFSAWLRYKQGQATGWDRIVGRKSAYNSGSGWEISLAENDAASIDIRGGSQSSTGGRFFATPVNDGEWHYVTVVYEGTSVTAYENGVKRVEGTIETAPIDNDHDLVFGNNSPRNETSFKGVLDEIRLYPGVPSAARVLADYLTVTQELIREEYTAGTLIILR